MSASKPGYIAVDFDGTLCHDDFHPINGVVSAGFEPGAEVTGKPVQAMVDRIYAWRANGYEVRILTARTEWAPVHAWLIKHLGYDLEVSNIKGHGILAIFDDRAVRVCRNRGEVCDCYVGPDDVRNVAVPYDRWIPEAPQYPGLYATKYYVKITQTCTTDVHSSMQFTTKEACQRWCDANPHPVFEPRCHGFG